MFLIIFIKCKIEIPGWLTKLKKYLFVDSWINLMVDDISNQIDNNKK